MKSYLENLKLDISSLVEEKNGLSYLSWPIAMNLAGRPQHRMVLFGNSPYLPICGGGVVAVDMGGQRTWLPILDGENKPIYINKINSRDILNSFQRCRTKAIAMTYGIGMSLYAGFGGNGSQFVEALGVTERTDLSKVEAITNMKEGNQYVNWAAAVAAAKITDPGFRWEVDMFESFASQPLPYLSIGNTFLVSITVTYKGVTHTELLPIMGTIPVRVGDSVQELDHQPLTSPNVFDWNRSVMRCLAKAIAVVSGYGLSVYAGEDLDWAPEKKSGKPDLTGIRQLIEQSGKDEVAVCNWLGVNSLEEATQEQIAKAETVLRNWLKKKVPVANPAD